MKRQKQHTGSKKRVLVVAIAVVLLAAGGGAAYALHHHKTPAKKAQSALIPGTQPIGTINYSPSQPSDNTANNQRKSNPGSAPPTLSNGSGNTTPNPNISVTVTRAGVVAGNLQVGTLVSGATSGTCTLSASQSGQPTVTQTQQISQQNNAYACAVFNVPASNFSNNGPWTITVGVSTNAGTASGAWQGNPVYLK